MSTTDLMETTEFAVETRIREMYSSIDFLNSRRRDNTARKSIIDNAAFIEVARDRLSRILDDVGGK